jgi:acyl phosphate:glycerol-3-phosphate acyltransferase
MRAMRRHRAAHRINWESGRATPEEPVLDYVLVALLAYLIGAIPFAYLVVRVLTGRDIRQLGSGNVGVMNTVRQAGMPAGILVFLAEGVKGVTALGVGRILVGTEGAVLLAAFCALVGVNWSVFVGFAGGRGTTVSLFMLVQVSLLAFLILALIWFALYAVRRNNFLSTRAVIVALPVVAWALTFPDWRFILCALGFSAVLLVRHRRETDDHLAVVSAHVPAATED